ncbi:hypothetical protein SDC9_129231 [bioreactor metagenome]|uniref:Uncharacterized protein n=1 Tax=bioreactor metagenome TaxID=1076179 RepID=A0A645CY83_9ZZZZ
MAETLRNAPGLGAFERDFPKRRRFRVDHLFPQRVDDSFRLGVQTAFAHGLQHIALEIGFGGNGAGIDQRPGEIIVIFRKQVECQQQRGGMDTECLIAEARPVAVAETPVRRIPEHFHHGFANRGALAAVILLPHRIDMELRRLVTGGHAQGVEQRAVAFDFDLGVGVAKVDEVPPDFVIGDQNIALSQPVVFPHDVVDRLRHFAAYRFVAAVHVVIVNSHQPQARHARKKERIARRINRGHVAVVMEPVDRQRKTMADQFRIGGQHEIIKP